jgi:hypothetical protein
VPLVVGSPLPFKLALVLKVACVTTVSLVKSVGVSDCFRRSAAFAVSVIELSELVGDVSGLGCAAIGAAADAKGDSVMKDIASQGGLGSPDSFAALIELYEFPLSMPGRPRRALDGEVTGGGTVTVRGDGVESATVASVVLLDVSVVESLEESFACRFRNPWNLT